MCRKENDRIYHAFEKIGYRDVRGQLYDNMRHDILHERDKERVFRDILRFIGK